MIPEAPPYIAFYDLDRTILSENSATHLVKEARSRGIMSDRQYRQALFLSLLHLLHLGDPVRMIGRMLGWIRGLEVEVIDTLCRDIVEDRLRHLIRPAIRESMAGHRAKGASVVLLSSAARPLCEPMGNHLAFDAILCTDLEQEKGVLTGRTRGRLAYAREKQRRMLAHCLQQGQEPRLAWYYGDSISDRFVMQAVGNPVAVAPDRRLARLARRLGWEILPD
ncbi:MAG: HAD-IB family hydrolase [Bacteroidales bacterium]